MECVPLELQPECRVLLRVRGRISIPTSENRTQHRLFGILRPDCVAHSSRVVCPHFSLEDLTVTRPF